MFLISTEILGEISQKVSIRKFTVKKSANSLATYSVYNGDQNSEMNLISLEASPRTLYVKSTSKYDFIIYIPSRIGIPAPK